MQFGLENEICCAGIGCCFDGYAYLPQELWQAFLAGTSLVSTEHAGQDPLPPALQLTHAVRAAIMDNGACGPLTRPPVVLLGNGLLDIDDSLRQVHPDIIVAAVHDGVLGALALAANILAADRASAVVLLVANFAQQLSGAANTLTGAVALVLQLRPAESDAGDDGAVYAALHAWDPLWGCDQTLVGLEVVGPSAAAVDALLCPDAAGTPWRQPMIVGTSVDVFGYGGVLSQALGVCKVVLALFHATLPPQSATATAWMLLAKPAPGTLQLGATQWPVSLAPEAAVALMYTNHRGEVCGIQARRAPVSESDGDSLPTHAVCFFATKPTAAQAALARTVQTLPQARAVHQSQWLSLEASGGTCNRGFVACAITNQLVVHGASSAAAAAASAPLWFVCGGLGTQWAGMGRPLWHSAAFRRSVALSQRDLASAGLLCGTSLEELLLTLRDSAESPPNLVETFVGIVAMQIAVWDTLRDLGVGNNDANGPPGFIGHSVGEITCAYLTGAVTRSQALRVAAVVAGVSRRHFAGAGGPAPMLAVALSQQDATVALANLSTESPAVWIACDNGPTSVTLAGDPAVLARLAVEFKRQGLATSTVWSSGVPFHCPALLPAAAELRAALAAVLGTQSVIRAATWLATSASSGDSTAQPDTVVFDVEFIVRNFTGLVQFRAAALQLPPGCTVIDLSAHPLLAALLAHTRPTDLPPPLAALSREMRVPDATLSVLLGHCFVRGLVSLDAIPAALICPTRVWRQAPAGLLWPANFAQLAGRLSVHATQLQAAVQFSEGLGGYYQGVPTGIHCAPSLVGSHAILSPGELLETVLACFYDLTGVVAGAAVVMSHVAVPTVHFLGATAEVVSVSFAGLDRAALSYQFSLHLAGAATTPLLTGLIEWSATESSGCTHNEPFCFSRDAHALECRAQLYARLAARGLTVPVASQSLHSLRIGSDGRWHADVAGGRVGAIFNGLLHGAMCACNPASRAQSVTHIARLVVRQRAIVNSTSNATQEVPATMASVIRISPAVDGTNLRPQRPVVISAHSAAVDIDGLCLRRLSVLPVMVPRFARAYLASLFSEYK